MALHWTYNADFSNTSAGYSSGSTIGVRDQIRLLIQDTQTTRQLLQDEEIDWYQTQEANVYHMAAACCESLVARAGGTKFKKISEFAVAYDVGFYRGLAVQLRARGDVCQVPYAGGISVADKLAQQRDPDWVQPAISRNIDNNPAAPQPAIPGVNPIGSNPLTEI